MRGLSQDRPPVAEGKPAEGEPREAVLASSALSAVGWALLWVLVQRGMFTTSLSALSPRARAAASLVLMGAVCASALAVGLRPGLATRLVRARRAPAALAVACSAILAARYALVGALGAGGGDTAMLVVLAVLLAAEGAAFCLVFLAWSLRLEAEARDDFKRAVLVQVAAIAASFFLAPLDALGSGYMTVMQAAALPLSAACLAVASGMEPVADASAIEGASSAPGPGRRAVSWLAATAAGFFLVGLVGYAPEIVGGMSETYSEGWLSFGFALLTLAPLAYLCLHPDSERLAAGVALAATLVILLCFFALTLVISSGSGFQYELARFTRRVSRVMLFMLVTLAVARLGIPAARAFPLAFLLPAFLPKVVLYAVQLGAPGVAAGAGSEAAGAALAVVGFLLTACMAVTMFIGATSQVLGALVQGAPAGASADSSAAGPDTEPDALRCQACERIAQERGLTERELQVLELFSAGNSLRRTCEELSLSKGTVNTHSQSLYRKLGVHSKQEVIDLVGERMREAAGGPQGR